MQEQRTCVVTISRQMASGGAYIGYLAARKLGFRYVEREVLLQAARELGVDTSSLADIEERKTGFLENLIRGFAYGTPEAAYVPPSRRTVYDSELFEAESGIIRSLARKYSCVIIGRAGYSVLKDRPAAVHVYVHAPLDFRIKRLQQFHDLTPEQAREELEESDRRREKFLKTMAGADWWDARNYDLAINSAALEFEAARDMIVGLVENIPRQSGE